MKILNVPDKGIELVKMSQIQNFETIGYIAQTMKEKGIINLSDINILDAPSMGYVKTTMTQAGYDLKTSKIIEKGQYISYQRLKSGDFNIPDDFLEKYNLTPNTKLYINFDIEISVTPRNK